jgi:WD40 repeat protein
VNSVAFHPEGRRIASAGADGVVRIWDLPMLPKGQPTATGVLKEHTGAVTAVAWSETGLFSAGADGRVLYWRFQRGQGRFEELFRLNKQVLALAVTPDGELLAAAGDAEPDEDEPVIQLYRPLTDRNAGTLRGHTGLAIHDLSFGPDGKRLASAGRDGTVRVWDVSALEERAVFRPEKEPRPTSQDASARQIRSVSFGKDGLSVVSGGQDGAIRLWNFAGQREETIELGVRAPLAAAGMSADASVLAVAEKVLNQVKVWQLGDPLAAVPSRPTRTLRGLLDPPHAVAVNEDGSVIAAATAGGVYVWTDDDAHPMQVATQRALSLAARGNDLVFATDDGDLRWLDAATGQPRHRLTRVLARPSLVVFSPDGKKLISAGTFALQVWDATTGELLFESPLAHTRRITAAAVAHGPTTGPSWDLATADEGGLVKVWEFRPRPPNGNGDPPPPGQVLVVKERPAPAGLNDPVQSLAFTADGRTLATGGADRAVRLRDPETGQERAALAGHTDTVLLVAFRADRVLLTVGREGFVRAWRAAK